MASCSKNVVTEGVIQPESPLGLEQHEEVSVDNSGLLEPSHYENHPLNIGLKFEKSFSPLIRKEVACQSSLHVQCVIKWQKFIVKDVDRIHFIANHVFCCIIAE